MVTSVTLWRDQDSGSLQYPDRFRSVRSVGPGVNLVRHAEGERRGDEEARSDDIGRLSDGIRLEARDADQQ